MNSMYYEKTICAPACAAPRAILHLGFDMAYRRMRRRERAKDALKALGVTAAMALSAALPMAWLMMRTIK